MNNNVYYIKAKKFEPLDKMLKRLSELFIQSQICRDINSEDFTAVKIHCGEESNTTAVKPQIIKRLADELKEKTSKIFITDTNVLYRSGRTNAVDHLHLMAKRGFDIKEMGVPVIIADGLSGSSAKDITIKKKYYQDVSIAADIAMANAMLVISHPTGHLATGYGGALKNLGMGCASRKGKLLMHSKIKPKINEKKCTACYECIKWCPQEIITMVENKAKIDREKCIGCGQCLTVCRFDAVKFNWKIDPEEFQEKIIEYAFGAVKGKENKVGYINILMDITRDCDCIVKNQEPLMQDIGVLASTDPVAIDTATLYLIKEKNNKRLRDMAYDIDYTIQLKYAQELQMGSIDFNLVIIE